jgi:hypothetical protein
MAVTEIALFKGRSGKPLSSSSASLMSHLRKGIDAQQAFSKYPVRLLSQVDDPSYIYLIGGWDSVAHHWEDWIPSATNQEVMNLIKDEIEFQWLLHVDIDPKENAERTPLDATTVRIRRFFIKSGMKQSFEGAFNTADHRLAALPNPIPQICAGWRVDKEGSDEEKDEFVLFTGWNGIAHHESFANTDGFQEFQTKVGEFVDETEVKDIVKLVVL